MSSFVPSREVFNAALAVASSPQYSNATKIPYAHDVGYTIALTGTTTGTVVVQVANSPDEDFKRSTDAWVDYGLVPLIPVVSGAFPDGTANATIELRELGLGAVRLKITTAASTGTAKVVVTTKARA